MSGPCGWVVEQCGCGSCWEVNTPATRASASALATMVMWAATGRRYGICEVTVLPVNARPLSPLYQTYPVAFTGEDSGPWMTPVLINGQWSNRCNGGCGCSSACEVDLPGPVVDIVDVTIDGDTVDPAAYEVHDGHILVRKDGGCWPLCQQFGVAVPGFEVTYHRGQAIPVAVQRALELLACEFAASCTGGECRLPVGLQSLTRQGVSVQVDTTTTNRVGQLVAGRLRTGIPIVDAIIEADNPAGLSGRREVYSPDQPARVRVVTWAGGS